MGARKQVIYRYVLLLLKDLSSTGRDWIKSQKQSAFIILGWAGPVSLALPVFTYEAFNSLDQKIAVITNLLLVFLISTSTSIFCNSAHKFSHSGILNSLPLDKLQRFIMCCTFSLFSNFLFIISLIVSLAVGLVVYEGSGNFLAVLWRISIYASSLCVSSHFISYFRIPFAISVVLLFTVGYMTMFYGVLTVFLVLALGSACKFLVPKASSVRLPVKPSMLGSLIAKSSLITFSVLILFALMILGLSDSFSQAALITLSTSVTMLLSESISWAITFYKNNYLFVNHLPFGKQIMKSTLVKFIALTILVQSSFGTTIFLLSSNDTSLITLQLLSMSNGLIFAIFKDDFRLASQVIILLIYLMSVF